VSFDDGRTYHIKGIGTIHIKLYDEMIRELKDVRYVPQLKNLISVEALEAQGLRGLLKKAFSNVQLLVYRSERHSMQ